MLLAFHKKISSLFFIKEQEILMQDGGQLFINLRFNLRVFPVSKAGGKPPLQPANRWTGHLFQYAFLGELKEVRN